MTNKTPRDPNALPATISSAESPTLPPSGWQSDAVKPPVGIEETIAPGPSRGDDATMPPSAKQQPLPAVGAKVRYFGDYELLEEIARGGMGVVYKARQVSLNRVVALKMILSGQLAGKDDVQRFHAEAEAAANLDHPGIVPIYEVGEHDGMHFFSMSLIDGGSLASKLKDGPLPPHAAAEYTQKVTAAIAFAHGRGVIHRDLKPANVLLDRNGEPKVTDFGLAKQVQGDSHLTTTGQILGTPSYMPPEQAAGKIAEIGPAADIYSLGAILYALLTGRPPFQSDNPMDTLLQVLQRDPVPPRQLNSKLPADLETICLKCLEKSPDRRYRSGEALSEELGRYLRGEPIFARPIGNVERGWRWCKRKPAIASMLGTIALLVFIGTTVATIAAFKFKSLAEQERQTAANEREAKQKADAASRAATTAQKEAETERNAARAAQERSLDTLASSLYQQASAVGSSSRPGKRWSTLDLLKSAEELRGRKRDLNLAQAVESLPSSTIGSELPSRSDLRSEAVAALIMSDARLMWERAWDTGVSNPSLAANAERAALGWYDAADYANARGVRVFDLADGRDVSLDNSQRLFGFPIALSADGRTVASVQSVGLVLQRKAIGLWNVATGQWIKNLEFPREANADSVSGNVQTLEFSPDGRFLAALNRGHAIVWNVETAAARVAAISNNVPGQTLAFCHDSKYLVHRSDAKEMLLWSLESEQGPVKVESPFSMASRFTFWPQQKYAAPDGGPVMAISGYLAAPKSAAEAAEIVEASAGAAQIVLWNPLTKTRHGGIQLPRQLVVNQFALDQPGNLLAVADYNGSIYVFDLVERLATEVFRLESVHQGMLLSLAWSSDSRRLWSAGVDGALKCWERFEQPFSTAQRSFSLISPCLAIDPRDGSIAMVPSSFNPTVQLISRETGATVRELKAAETSPPRKRTMLNQVLFSADGRQMALVGEFMLVLWDTTEGEEVAHWNGARETGDQLTSVAFTADGRLLASGATEKYGKTAIVWDVASGQRLWQATKDFLRARLSPDGRWIVVATDAQREQARIAVWNLKDEKEIVELQDVERERGKFAGLPQFSPDGQWLAAIGGLTSSRGSTLNPSFGFVGAANAYLALWRLPTGERQEDIRGSSAPTSFAFSPDNGKLVVGYQNGSVELWNLEPRELLFRWREQSNAISQLRFTPDGASIVTVAGPSGMRFLDLIGLRQGLNGVGLDW